MRYVVTGRVHPERANVSISPCSWTHPDGGEVVVRCESSQLTVTLDDPRIDGHVSAFVTAEHVAQAVVSALGFSLATGYSVELIQVLEESGAVHVFGVRTPELMFEPHGPVFAAAAELSKRDLFFRMALADYARAFRDSLACAAYCYRAIEAIKSAFGPGDDSRLWPKMHDALGTDRENIDRAVKPFADPVRHGNWSELPPTHSAQRAEMLRITRDVLARYLSFRRPSA